MNYTADDTFHGIFWLAARAVRIANVAVWDPNTGYIYGPHQWHNDLQGRYELHPVVRRIVKDGVRPINWQLLLLEWPHVSEDDCMQIAYTRDDRKGDDNVQTRTSIGKYLSRHWPHVPDHVRRDWGEAYGTHKFEIWDTKEKIICGIELGPQSCMKSSYGNIPFEDSDNHSLCTWFAGNTDTSVPWSYHPYIVYAPEYGWRMAVRLDPGKPDIVLGRGLVNVNQMAFVRTYKRGEYDHSNSGTDERLESWLKGQGYHRASCWDDGLKLRKLSHPTDESAPFMVPYLDGSTQKVEARHDYLVIDCDGDYQCTNTDGSPEDNSNDAMGDCDDCGETVYESDEDRIWAGPYNDQLIGGSCGCCNNYTHVRGNVGGRALSYYVHNDNVVEVRDRNYDAENLPDYICELHDGEFEHEDYCVWVESQSAYYAHDDVVRCETDDEYYVEDDDALVEIDNKWYRKDDDNVVKCYDDEYRMKDDCWVSPAGNWHSADYNPIEVEAGQYSADELREIADNNE